MLFHRLTIIACCFVFTATASHVSVVEYIDTYKDLAVSEMQRSGIPASIKLAQGILESQHGNSLLSRKSNNHFGIKCKKEWKGKTYYYKDDDRNKEGHLINSCFRAYTDVIDSYIDHTEFLVNRDRYGFLFGYHHTDYKNWAYGLKKAGYATAPHYAESIIGIIERNNLNRFDFEQYSITSVAYNNKIKNKIPDNTVSTEILFTMPKPNIRPPSKTEEPTVVLPKPVEKETIATPEIVEITEIVNVPVKVPNFFPLRASNNIFAINGINAIQLQANSSIPDIAKENSVSIKKIYKINDITEYLEPIPNQYVFLKKKKSRFLKKDYHIVEKGETMYIIAQLYGIQLKKLLKRNLLKEHEEPATNELIKLNGRALEEKPTLRVDNIEFFEPEVKLTSKPSVEPTIAPGLKKKEEAIEKANRKTATTTTPIANEEKYHIVEKGDTLYKISKKVGVSISKIKELNGLTSNVISLNQKLRLE